MSKQPSVTQEIETNMLVKQKKRKFNHREFNLTNKKRLKKSNVTKSAEQAKKEGKSQANRRSSIDTSAVERI